MSAVDYFNRTDNPHGFHTAIVLIVHSALATLFLGLRLFNRLFILEGFALDDWIILGTLPCSLIYTILVCLETKYGSGMPEKELTAKDGEMFFRLLFGSIITYHSGLTFVKFSLLFQYKRIFRGVAAKRAIYVLMAATAVFGLYTVLSTIFLCSPTAAFWTGNGKCLSELVVWFVIAAFNIASDLAIFILPIPLVQQLQLRDKQKYALWGVFTLGFFVCLCSILRLHSLYVVSVASDKSTANPGISMWTGVELNIAIVCACLPTLKNSMSRAVPRSLSLSAGNRTYDPEALSRVVTRRETRPSLGYTNPMSKSILARDDTSSEKDDLEYKESIQVTTEIRMETR